jgi:hypothetical protein
MATTTPAPVVSYKDKLKAQCTDLKASYADLMKFVNTSPKWIDVSLQDRGRIQRQADLTRSLIEIMEERLAAIE